MEDNNPEESTMIPEMIVKVKKNVGKKQSKGETVTLLEPSVGAKTGADRIQKAREALEKKRAISIKQAPVPEELLRKIVSEEIEKKKEIKKKEKEAAMEQRRLEEEKQQRKKEKLERIKQEAIQEYVSKNVSKTSEPPSHIEPPNVPPIVTVVPNVLSDGGRYNVPPKLSARDRLMKLYGY
jgi:hypothetical protein